jgi:hypothetical protein
MAVRPARVLLLGVSTRAIADSAARAGFQVISIDAFGDLDQPVATRSLALPRDLGVPYSAAAAAHAAHDIACDAVAYVANFENHPDAVRALARGRALWGNPAAVLARVRDPLLLTRALARRGFATPAVRARAARRSTTRWLVKPRASGGGQGIRAWRAGARVGRGEFLQERVAGVPGSVVFAADGARAIPLGVSRQIVGGRPFGATGFRYCGSILAGDDPVFDDALCDAAGALAHAVTEEFGLVGVNGIDFVVARDGVPVPVEVNPRYSASMELVERAYGINVFAAHVRACAGALPAFDLTRARRRAPGAVGKAILHARRVERPTDTERWLADPDVRDVPRPGERIGRGRPVCTVFASAPDAVACRAALEGRAAGRYHALAAAPRSAS